MTAMEGSNFLERVEQSLESQLIAGAKGGSKKQTVRTPVEAPDNLRSRAYVRVLDFLSEGPIFGLVNGFKSIYLDGTPVQNPDGSYNFKDMVYQATLGTADQDYLGVSSAVEREVDVSLDLKQQYPYTFTVENTVVDAVRIKVRSPSLQTQNATNGDTKGATAKIDVYVSGANDPSPVFNQTIVLSGKTTNPWEKEAIIDLPEPGPWQVKLVRTTPDSKTNTLQNDTTVAGYTEIIYAKLRYPYSALVAMSFDAQQFGSIPARGFEIKGLLVKVPTNFDPVKRTYSGFWDGTWKTAWTNDPAWCYLDVLTHPRYGLGQYVKIDNVDVGALYEISKYSSELVSDGKGGLEHRFSCNAYIQTRQEAYTLLKSMTSMFRAMVFWSGSMVTVSQDRPQPVVRLITNANVVDGEFSYISSKKNTRYTAAYVAYNNPDDSYKIDRVYVEDTDGILEYGLIETDMTAWGCTSRAQAIRLGRWALYSNLYETDMVVFTVSLEGLRFMPGSIISVNDQMRRGTDDGGRLFGYNNGYFTLDKGLFFFSEQRYTINWMSKDGRALSKQLMAGLSGEENTVYVGELPEADQPTELGIYTISSTMMASALYRVVSIDEEDGMLFSVRAIEHHPSKYDQIEKNIIVDEAPTMRKANPPKPTNLKLTDELYISGESVNTSMTLAVDYQAEALKYTFMYRREDSEWVTVTTDQASITVRNVAIGTYEVRAYTTNVLKLNSDVALLTAEVLGKTRPPENIKNFTATLTAAGITLNWQSVADLDLDLYEIRVGNSWSDGVVVGTAKASTLSWVPPKAGTTFTFHIRALDTSGNYSELTTTITTNFERPENVESFSVVQSGSKMRWKWVAADRAASYEVRCGETFELGEPLFRTTGTQFEMEWGRVGEKFFWIKGVDYIGNTSEVAYFANTDSQQPSGRNQIVYYDVASEGWPGAKYNTEAVGGYLQLKGQAGYGEYYYQVDMGKTFRNIVTIDYEAQAIGYSTLSWADMTFSWDSVDAQIPWVDGGDFGSISIRTYISYRTALTPNVITSFRLNGDAISEDQLVYPATIRGVSYEPCRFALGAKIDDTSLIRWDVNLPTTFTMFFTVKIGDVTTPTGYVALGAGAQGMRVVYYPTLRRLKLETLFLEDEPVEVELDLQPGDLLQIGVSQSQAEGTRNLFAQRLGYPSVFSSGAAAVRPAFTSISLTGHYIN